MASSNEKEYTVTVTETKTWRVKINASSSEKAEEIVCERHGPIENKTEAEYEAVFGGAEILDRDWDIKTCADAECDNCGETEDLIITEDNLVTCEACDPACYKCGYRSWKWSIVLCERLDETSGWNEGLYCMKCIEESETVEGKPAKDEEEDEDSEDEVGVDEIEFEGTTYWVGEDNTVYGGTMTDPLAVGTWNADEKRIIFH